MSHENLRAIAKAFGVDPERFIAMTAIAEQRCAARRGR